MVKPTNAASSRKSVPALLTCRSVLAPSGTLLELGWGAPRALQYSKKLSLPLFPPKRKLSGTSQIKAMEQVLPESEDANGATIPKGFGGPRSLF